VLKATSLSRSREREERERRERRDSREGQLQGRHDIARDTNTAMATP